jgi:4-hydroxy-tetrahydrodipicolinate synthase
MNSKFKGTGVDIVTPFRNSGSIDFNSLRNIIEHVIKNNINYIVTLETTGEASTLSKDEKNAVLNVVIEAVNKRVPVVVGMGGNNTQEVINSIMNMETNFDGIDAILSVAPYYNKPNQRGIFSHYKAIANASPVPVIIYNVPERTSVNIEAKTVLKLADEVGGIIGIKEASGNLMQCMDIIKNKPNDFLVISGVDALILPLMCLGADGVISVVANAFPKEFSKIVELCKKGSYERAKEMHYKLIDIIKLLFVEGTPVGIKAALEILGLSPNNLRLPLVKITKSTHNQLANLIEKYKKND